MILSTILLIVFGVVILGLLTVIIVQNVKSKAKATSFEILSTKRDPVEPRDNLQVIVAVDNVNVKSITLSVSSVSGSVVNFKFNQTDLSTTIDGVDYGGKRYLMRIFNGETNDATFRFNFTDGAVVQTNATLVTTNDVELEAVANLVIW